MIEETIEELIEKCERGKYKVALVHDLTSDTWTASLFMVDGAIGRGKSPTSALNDLWEKIREKEICHCCDKCMAYAPFAGKEDISGMCPKHKELLYAGACGKCETENNAS